MLQLQSRQPGRTVIGTGFHLPFVLDGLLFAFFFGLQDGLGLLGFLPGLGVPGLLGFDPGLLGVPGLPGFPPGFDIDGFVASDTLTFVHLPFANNNHSYTINDIKLVKYT